MDKSSTLKRSKFSRRLRSPEGKGRGFYRELVTLCSQKREEKARTGKGRHLRLPRKKKSQPEMAETWQKTPNLKGPLITMEGGEEKVLGNHGAYKKRKENPANLLTRLNLANFERVFLLIGHLKKRRTLQEGTAKPMSPRSQKANGEGAKIYSPSTARSRSAIPRTAPEPKRSKTSWPAPLNMVSPLRDLISGHLKEVCSA